MCLWRPEEHIGSPEAVVTEECEPLSLGSVRTVCAFNQ